MILQLGLFAALLITETCQYLMVGKVTSSRIKIFFTSDKVCGFQVEIKS